MSKSEWGKYIFITKKEGNKDLFHFDTGIGNKPKSVMVHQTRVDDCAYDRVLYHYYIERTPRISSEKQVEVIQLFPVELYLPVPECSAQNFISIGIAGRFNHPLWRFGNGSPSSSQMKALAGLWMHLKSEYELSNSDLFGHSHFGNPTCPGTVIDKWIERVRLTDHRNIKAKSILDVQNILHTLGYLEDDSLHGVYDINTRHSIKKFEKDYAGLGLVVDGSLDSSTSHVLEMAYNSFVSTGEPLPKCPKMEPESE